MGSGIAGNIDGGSIGGGGGPADTTPPTIAITSPTPGVAAGAPGGFPANTIAYASTPVIATVFDAVAVALVVVTFLDITTGQQIVVFSDGKFWPPFTGSAVTVVSGGTTLTLTITKTDGWPLAGFRLTVKASDGNVST